VSILLPPPPALSPYDVDGKPVKAWIDWALAVHRHARKYRGADTTANRPTNALENGDWYFDTTVGKPIWYSGSGWVYADGTAA